MHNDILSMLMNSMRAKRQGTVRQERLDHDDRYYWSDGSFFGENGKKYQVDVSVVWNGSMKKRYDEKMTHATNPELFIPFVVGADGSIYIESLLKMQELAPELTDERLTRVVLIPLAKRAAQRARTVAKVTTAAVAQYLPESSGLELEQEPLVRRLCAPAMTPSRAGDQELRPQQRPVLPAPQAQDSLTERAEAQARKQSVSAIAPAI